MSVSVTDLHRHLAKYQEHHKALRAHHHHVAKGEAAKRAATGAAVPTMTDHPLSGTAGPSEGAGPPQRTLQ